MQKCFSRPFQLLCLLLLAAAVAISATTLLGVHAKGIQALTGQTHSSAAIVRGKFKEFIIPTASSVPRGITKGPDGALWFTEAGSNQIGRITTAGVITEFPVPTPNSIPEGITTGPDRALWFTEENGNQIGRVTPAGVFAEFPVPTANSAPFGITRGARGVLWFTEQSANRIGELR